jgi:outer membrane protein
VIEARAGYLPSLVSTGLAREREHQSNSNLRNEDYNASVRIVQNVYTGGAVSNQMSIAQLNLEKQELELAALTNRVMMDVRIAFNELLLNRAKVGVREQSVNVLQQELKTQAERFSAGTVGQLNVRRAEVALASEQPELVDAQTQLKNSYLRLGELFGTDARSSGDQAAFEINGRLGYQPRHPDLNACLARADAERPEIRMRQIDVAIEDRQAEIDRSGLRPQLEIFSGYEVYNERDTTLPNNLNHGYVVGLNAKWNIFDGFATKGRLIATQARREAALQNLAAAKLSVASEVRSALLDLQQADKVLESETQNVQNADESLEIAKVNLDAGLGTQLDILQAATDVTRTRTTRLSAIYLHNVAVARLAKACAATPTDLEFRTKEATTKAAGDSSSAAAVNVAQPPRKLSQR